jgi:hypothetical protein
VANNIPPPPPGFTLVAPSGGNVPPPPPGFTLLPGAGAPAPAAPLDMRRPAPGAVDDMTWFRQTYGRDPISADQAGTNDPAAFRRTFGFDPIGAVDDGRPLGDDPIAARSQADPQGQAAYQAAVQGRMPQQPTTAGWDEQGFDTNNGPMDWLRAAGQGVFGLGDELEGAVGGIGGVLSGRGWQPGYDSAVTNARTEIDEFRNANPTAATALEIGGAVPTMFLPGMAAAARGVTAVGRVARGAAAGAATGAATGFGLGEGSPAERLPGALQGLIPGAAAGGVLPLAAPIVSRLLTGRSGGSALAGIIPESADDTAQRSILARQPMTTDELGDAGRAAYRRADDAGVIVPQNELAGFYIDARSRALDLGADLNPGPGVASNTPMSAGVLRRIDAATSNAGLPTGLMRSYDLQELSRIREAINGAAGNYANVHDQKIAVMLRDEFDEWLGNLNPNQIVAGNIDEATAALREARDLWGRYRRSETLDQLQERALNAVGANFTQAGAQTALRQQFRALANNPKQFNRFPLDEQQAIIEIVRGGSMENALRRIGVFAPRGFFSTMFAFGGATAGNIPMMALSAVGEAAKRTSGAMTNNNINRLRRTLGGAGGGILPPSFGTQQAVQGVLGAANAYAMPRLTLIPEEYLPIPAGLR